MHLQCCENHPSDIHVTVVTGCRRSSINSLKLYLPNYPHSPNIADLEGSPRKLFKLLLNWDSPKAAKGRTLHSRCLFPNMMIPPTLICRGHRFRSVLGSELVILSKKAIDFKLPEAATLFSIYLRTYYIQSIQEKLHDVITVVFLLTFLFQTFRFPSEH